MISTLFVVQIILAIILTITILLQKSSSIGLGAYSGSNESLFGAKGPANFLAKATMFLGLLFVINTLILGYLYNEKRLASVVDSAKVESLVIPQKQAQENKQAPITPSHVPDKK